MYTMSYDIRVGHFKIGMLERVDIKKSVELLADTAEIVLPAAEYNKALSVENKLHRGDLVSIKIGYKESGLVEEFRGYLQSVSTDSGSITLKMEDDLYTLRKEIPNETHKRVKLSELLASVLSAADSSLKVQCDYEWTYEKFVIHDATAYDVLKKVQEECAADIYIQDGTLHVHPPGAVIGQERLYDFSLNVEECNLTYRNAEDRKFKVVVKAKMPDGMIKELEVGSTGGNRIEVKCPTSDEESMKLRGEAELKRRSFDGYEGSITTWLIPECYPGDTAEIRDRDYPEKDGVYFVKSVTTEFSKDGGKRNIELGFKLS
jgi:phage protein D